MLGRTLAFSACVLGLAVVFVPSGKDVGAEQLEGENARAIFATRQSNSPDWFAGEHTLERQPDGHFYASVSVDGVPIRMVVDTGASVIALTAADAQAAGIYWDDSEVRHVGEGASGAVFGVPTRLTEVEIGGIVRRNVDAVILPRGLGVSLLGQSYLSQIDTVEIADGQMTLKPE